MKKKDVENLERIIGQMEGLQAELGALAKKSPNDGVNTFKLRYINQIISDANNELGENYIPLRDFDGFQEDDVPSNSDVTFVVSQYLDSLERKRADNIAQKLGSWSYVLEDSTETIRTGPPKKIMK